MQFIKRHSLIGIVTIIMVIIFALNSQLAIGSENSDSNHWEMGLSLQGGTSTAVSQRPMRSHSLGVGTIYFGRRTVSGFGFGLTGSSIAVDELTQDRSEQEFSQKFQGGGMGFRVGQKMGRFEFFAGSSLISLIPIADDAGYSAPYAVGHRFSALNSEVGIGLDLYKSMSSALTLTANAGIIEPINQGTNYGAGFGSPVTTSLGLTYNYKFNSYGSEYRSSYRPNTHVFIHTDGRIFYYIGKGLVEIAKVAPQLGTAVVKGVFGVLKAL